MIKCYVCIIILFKRLSEFEYNYNMIFRKVFIDVVIEDE